MAKNQSVKVAIRCRPLIESEVSEGCSNIIIVGQNNRTIYLGQSRSFTFDYVFDCATSQMQVYEDTVQPMVEQLLQGYNVTVLAYGQTGSGKSFTMGTTFEDGVKEGIAQLALSDIFRACDQQTDVKSEIQVSFMELYNEVLKDLLCKSSAPCGATGAAGGSCGAASAADLNIREMPDGEILVPNLTRRPAGTFDEAISTLHDGMQLRTVASTKMNNVSSRSHAIYTVCLERSFADGEVRRSKMHLVDLAGSERQKKTQAQGQRFKEGVAINQSLLALGKVIAALTDPKASGSSHVPYRDSKLTRLLQDSLGGNALTLMIACVSPADYNHEETLQTLNYASSVLRIQNKPTINRDPHVAEVLQLKATIRQLQQQLVACGATVAVCAGLAAAEPVAAPSAVALPHSDSSAANAHLIEQLKDARCQIDQMQDEIANLKREKAELYDWLLQLEVDHDAAVAAVEDGNKTSPVEAAVEKTELADETIEKTDVAETTGVGNATEIEAQATEREQSVRHQLSQLTSVLRAKQQEIAKARTEVALGVSVSEAAVLLRDDYHTLQTRYHAAQAEINDLHREMQELETQLRGASTNNKLAEQRRVRLRDLEKQLADARKKVTDADRMVKLKQEQEKRIKKLDEEMTRIKRERIRLLKQLSNDARLLQQLRMEKERDAKRFAERDLRLRVEMQRREQQHEKEQMVLRQKLELAAASSKRLKSMADLSKAVSQQKQQRFDKSLTAQQLKEQVDKELTCRLEIMQAKHNLEQLIEDRKNISAQLRALQLAPSPDTAQHAAELQSELELLRGQIADLQEQISCVEQEQRGGSGVTSSESKLLQTVTSMVEAKSVIKQLLHEVVAAQLSNNIKAGELNTVQAGRSSTEERLRRLEMENDELRRDLMAAQRENSLRLSSLQRTAQRVSVGLSPMADSIMRPAGERAVDDGSGNTWLRKRKVLPAAPPGDEASDESSDSDPDWQRSDGDDSLTTPRQPLSNKRRRTRRTTRLALGRILDGAVGKSVALAAPLDAEVDDLDRRLDDQLQSLAAAKNAGCKCTAVGGCTRKCGCVKGRRMCGHRCRCTNACANRVALMDITGLKGRTASAESCLDVTAKTARDSANATRASEVGCDKENVDAANATFAVSPLQQRPAGDSVKADYKAEPFSPTPLERTYDAMELLQRSALSNPHRRGLLRNRELYMPSPLVKVARPVSQSDLLL